MQAAPNEAASRTPGHRGRSSGARQRRSPTGGAAKGMFLNTVMPSTLPGAPWIVPCWVRTGADVPTAWAEAADAAAAITQARAVRSKRDWVMGCSWLLVPSPRAGEGGAPSGAEGEGGGGEAALCGSPLSQRSPARGED